MTTTKSTAYSHRFRIRVCTQVKYLIASGMFYRHPWQHSTVHITTYTHRKIGRFPAQMPDLHVKQSGSLNWPHFSQHELTFHAMNWVNALWTGLCVTARNRTSDICVWSFRPQHYSDVIMSAMAPQITGASIVYSGADQRKHQSSASLAFVRGIHRPVTGEFPEQSAGKCFHLITSSCEHPTNLSVIAWNRTSDICGW